MNIAELADQHLDALLRHTLESHLEQVRMLERALAGDRQTRQAFREMAKTLSQDLQGGVIQ